MRCPILLSTLPVRLLTIAFACLVLPSIFPLNVEALDLRDEEESKNVVDQRGWSAEQKVCYSIVEQAKQKRLKGINEIAQEMFLSYLIIFLDFGLSDDEAVAEASQRADEYEAAQIANLNTIMAQEFKRCVEHLSQTRR